MRSSVRLRAVAERKIQVQQHHVEGLHPPQVVGVLQRGSLVHAMALLAQAPQHHVAQDRIVFDQQDSHGAMVAARPDRKHAQCAA